MTLDIPGHTSLGISACASAITGGYLLDPTTAGAADGTVCPMEINPFATIEPSALGATGMTQQQLRAELLRIIAHGRPLVAEASLQMR